MKHNALTKNHQLIQCNNLIHERKPKKLIIAYSGGIDSSALLHYYACFLKKTSIKLMAMHINHQLHKESTQWVEHCQKICQTFHVPLTIKTITLGDQLNNLEERARNARYQAFKQMIEENDMLLTAHHIDDQIETFFLQLLRGSGLSGLSSMPIKKKLGQGIQLRPFLGLTRTNIQQYVKMQKLNWIDDPSNQETHLDRNYLRQQVIPQIAQRWPQYQKTLSRSIQHTQNHYQDLEKIISHYPFSFQASKLSLKKLNQYDKETQKLIIRFWLKTHQKKMPSMKQLHVIMQQMQNAKKDRMPLYQDKNIIIRRYHDYLFLDAPGQSTILSDTYLWQIEQPMILPHGQLIAEPKKGLNLLRMPENKQLIVKFRQGGESFHPQGRQGRHPLKKCMQEWLIPPWKRQIHPLIYHSDGHLIAVPNYSYEHHWQTETEKSTGICLYFKENATTTTKTPNDKNAQSVLNPCDQ